MSDNSNNAQPPAGPQFGVQTVYLRDASFEAPNTPQIFQEQGQPQMKVDLETRHRLLQEGVYEVVVDVTVTVTQGQKTAFLAEVQQGGIFVVAGFADEDADRTLGIFCPNILFPYAREVISGMVSKGGFPQLVLQPFNFEALYMQRKRQEAEGTTAH